MNLKKYIKSLSVLFLLGGLMCSCTDWLDTEPKDKQSEEQQFATKDGFRAAVNGIYNRMAENTLYGANLSYGMIDILGQYYEVEKDSEESYYKYLRALTQWNYEEEGVTGTLSSIWSEAYSIIMNINVILNNLEKDATGTKILSAKEYAMLKGEMLAARAMIHFDMLRMFGPIYSKKPEGRGIPYNESTETKILEILPANKVLNDYILRDLKDAEGLLLDSDPVITEGPRAEYDEVTLDNSMRYRQLRLNYYATVLLTARAYLWAENWEDALTEAKKLTDDSKVKEHFPFVDPNKLLQNNYDPDRMYSTESLFGFYNKDRGLVYKYNFGSDDVGKNLLIPRENYVKQICYSDPGDIRLQSLWEDRKTLNDKTSMGLVKYKDIIDQGKDDATEDKKDDVEILQAQKFYGTFCSCIKLIEAYYIAAEAAGNKGETGTGWKYMDNARDARGLKKIGEDKGMKELNISLAREYTREFVGEGQKFFFFKRQNKGFDNEFNGHKEVRGNTDSASDQDKEARFVLPLPKNEIDNR